MVHFGAEQVTLAWVGDTQIYHYKHKDGAIDAHSAKRGNPAARISGSTAPQSLLVQTIPNKDVRVGMHFW